MERHERSKLYGKKAYRLIIIRTKVKHRGILASMFCFCTYPTTDEIISYCAVFSSPALSLGNCINDSLYSLGVKPSRSLNLRLKLRILEKPDSKAISVIVFCELIKSSLAHETRFLAMYELSEVLKFLEKTVET